MKRLSCEACGSEGLLKQGDYYVCEYCGAKYTAEDIQKLIIDVSMKIDNSEQVKKHLVNARSARGNCDWEEAYRYYSLVKENDTENLEAIFYASYSKAQIALQESGGSDAVKRKNIFEALIRTLNSKQRYFVQNTDNDTKRLFHMINSDIIRILTGTFGYNTTTVIQTHKSEISTKTVDDKADTYKILAQCAMSYVDFVESIIQQNDQVYLHYALIKFYYGIKISNLNSYFPIRCNNAKASEFETVKRMILANEEAFEQAPGDYCPSCGNKTVGSLCPECGNGYYDFNLNLDFDRSSRKVSNSCKKSSDPFWVNNSSNSNGTFSQGVSVLIMGIISFILEILASCSTVFFYIGLILGIVTLCQKKHEVMNRAPIVIGKIIVVVGFVVGTIILTSNS